MSTKKKTTRKPTAKQLAARRKFAAAAKARAKAAQRKNTTIIRAKKIEHLDVSKVHSLGTVPNLKRNPNCEILKEAKPAKKGAQAGWQLGKQFIPKGKGQRKLPGGALLDLGSGFVYRKVNPAKRRNAPEFSSETPIEVKRHYRSGGPGYETKRQRIIKLGQRDLFAQDASVDQLLGYLRKNPTAIEAVRRKLGAKRFATASPSVLKRELKAVLTAEMKRRASKKASKKTRRNSEAFIVKYFTGSGWKWGIQASLKPGWSWSLKTYKSRTAAINAGKRETGLPFRDAARRNPDATEQAKQQFKDFHGYAPGKSVNVYIPDSAPTQGLSTLGEFYAFTFESGGNVKPLVKVWLLRDLKGRLHLGGTQAGAVMTNEPAGYIGTIKKIEYVAAKPHLGEPSKIIWFHRTGEEGGKQPSLFSDGKGGLLIKGGDYYITPEGIRD